MHWLIPFASGVSTDAGRAVPTLALPNLDRLLRRATLVDRDDGDAASLSPPHERAFAAAVGWRGDADGALPFAALAAARDGVDTAAAATTAWGLVSPCHWLVARDHVALTDPAALALDAAESRVAFDAASELFADAGLALTWGAPGRWYAAADALDGHRTASLDRVIGRDVERWLYGSAAPTPFARRLRRLQSEFQMLLYPHPLNDAREARGAPTLNSFWLSGCGRPRPLAADPPTVDDRLRAPALADDADAWAEAWTALDAGPIADALAAARSGQTVALTLCGERNAHRYATAPRSAWRWLAGSVGIGATATSPERVLAAL